MTKPRFVITWKRHGKFNRQDVDDFGRYFYDTYDAIKWAEDYVPPGNQYQIYRLTNGSVMDTRKSQKAVDVLASKPKSGRMPDVLRRHMMALQSED